MKVRLLMAAPLLVPLLAVLLPAASQAQVTVDVAKITCRQFLLDAVAPTKSVAIWLSGYYHGKRNDTVVDVQLLAENADKIKTYCRLKPEATVMQAVETVLRVPK